MHIVIKEKNDFMPDTTIKLMEDKIEVEEYNKVRVLAYNKNEIKYIISKFLNIMSNWKDKYIDSGIIDDDTFYIYIVGKTTRQIIVKNKYPFNWSDFILYRNKLLREEIKVVL